MSFFAAPLSNVTSAFTPYSLSSATLSPTPVTFTAYVVAICSAFATRLRDAAVWLLDRVERLERLALTLPPVPPRRMLVAPPRPPALGKLSLVACWASFLLATTAHADTGVAVASSSIITSILAMLGLASGGSVLLLLFRKFAPRGLNWLADDEVPAAVKIIEHDVDTSTEGMAHPEATAIIDHQLQNLAGNVSSALHKAGSDLSTLSALTPAALLAVAKDAAQDFLAGVDEDKLGQALEQLGAAEAPDVEAWVESQALKLLHISKPAAPPAPVATAKTVLTTPDGTKVVTSASDPSPGAAPLAGQSGFAASRLALVLALLGGLTFAACSAAQKATEVADVKALEAQVIDCGKAEVQAALPSATGDVLPLLAGGAADTTALEALAVKDGLEVAVCATEAVVGDLETAAAKPPDGGASIAAADLARIEARTRAFLVAHAHRAAPKKAG